jgi:hypothetical protein
MKWLVCRRCGVTVEAGDLICAGCTATLTEPGSVELAGAQHKTVSQWAEPTELRCDDPICDGEAS